MQIPILAAIAGLLLSCSGQGDPCVSDNECFFGEVCNDGTCGEPVLTVDTDTSDPFDVDADAQHDSGTPGGDDITSTDVSSPPDAAQADMSAPDMSEPPVDTGSSDSCVVDPFDICQDMEDPDNNSFPGVAFAPMTRGCQSSGFVPLDETVSGRQCALDPEDQYYLTVVECDADEPGMVIEATLDVKDDCDPALIWFDVESIGTSCAAPNPDSDKTLRCETLATGERRISIIWPGSDVPSVGSIRFSIQTPDRQDLQFDYDLRIVIREP